MVTGGSKPGGPVVTRVGRLGSARPAGWPSHAPPRGPRVGRGLARRCRGGALGRPRRPGAGSGTRGRHGGAPCSVARLRATPRRGVWPDGDSAPGRRWGGVWSSTGWKRPRSAPSGHGVWAGGGGNAPRGRRGCQASVGGSGDGRCGTPVVSWGHRVLVSWWMRAAVRSAGGSRLFPGSMRAYPPLPPVNAYVRES